MNYESSDLEKELILENLIGYTFKDPELRQRAITRKAWVNDHGPGNKITQPGLATLGDAVVGLVVVNYYFSLGNTPEKITNEKNSRVSRKNHTAIATEIGLKNYLKLGKCETNSKEWDMGDALGESFEEIIGAVYLDDIKNGGNGIDVCSDILKKLGLI